MAQIYYIASIMFITKLKPLCDTELGGNRTILQTRLYYNFCCVLMKCWTQLNSTMVFEIISAAVCLKQTWIDGMMWLVYLSFKFSLWLFNVNLSPIPMLYKYIYVYEEKNEEKKNKKKKCDTKHWIDCSVVL